MGILIGNGQFADQRVSKKEQLRRESVAQKRYHLCYTVKLHTEKHQIDLVGKKVSLPFAILVGPKADVEAKLFMERSFADFVRRPDGELPMVVSGTEMVNALEMKFQVLLAIVGPRRLKHFKGAVGDPAKVHGSRGTAPAPSLFRRLPTTFAEQTEAQRERTDHGGQFPEGK